MKRIKLATLWLVILSYAASAASTNAIQASHSLFINDLNVVNSKEATTSWSFMSLIKTLIQPGKNEQLVVIDWLKQWEQVSEVNNRPVQTFDYRNILRFWPTKKGELDFNRSPFLLSAILYRPDLTDEKNGGEFRLVYTGYDEVMKFPLQFTVIAEFNIPKKLEASIKAKFISFSKLPMGQELVNELDSVFQTLVSAENLGKIRVNDFIMNDFWDLREFKLVNSKLVMAPTAFTPPSFLNHEDETNVLNELFSNQEAILNGTYKLPKKLWGGMSIMPSEDFIWFENKDIDPDLKKSFSKLTCNGCHSGATNSRFVHLEPRAFNQPSKPSEYLKNELKQREKYLHDFRMEKHPYVH